MVDWKSGHRTGSLGGHSIKRQAQNGGPFLETIKSCHRLSGGFFCLKSSLLKNLKKLFNPIDWRSALRADSLTEQAYDKKQAQNGGPYLETKPLATCHWWLFFASNFPRIFSKGCRRAPHPHRSARGCPLPGASVPRPSLTGRVHLPLRPGAGVSVNRASPFSDEGPSSCFRGEIAPAVFHGQPDPSPAGVYRLQVAGNGGHYGPLLPPSVTRGVPLMSRFLLGTSPPRLRLMVAGPVTWPFCGDYLVSVPVHL